MKVNIMYLNWDQPDSSEETLMGRIKGDVFPEENYRKVYSFEINDCEDFNSTLLDELYEQFNLHHPAGFKDRSMCVGDLINLCDDDGFIIIGYVVLPIGFEMYDNTKFINNQMD